MRALPIRMTFVDAVVVVVGVIVLTVMMSHGGYSSSEVAREDASPQNFETPEQSNNNSNSNNNATDYNSSNDTAVEDKGTDDALAILSQPDLKTLDINGTRTATGSRTFLLHLFTLMGEGVKAITGSSGFMTEWMEQREHGPVKPISTATPQQAEAPEAESTFERLPGLTQFLGLLRRLTTPCNTTCNATADSSTQSSGELNQL